MNYSKGKWEYTESLGANFSMIAGSNTVICRLPNPIGADDCSNSPKEMEEMGIDKELKEMRANAHLIASAPDMYEALIAMVEVYKDIVNAWDNGQPYSFAEITSGSFRDTYEKSLNAIRKAEGKC